MIFRCSCYAAATSTRHPGIATLGQGLIPRPQFSRFIDRLIYTCVNNFTLELFSHRIHIDLSMIWLAGSR